MMETEAKCNLRTRELVLLENTEAKRLIPGSREAEAAFARNRTATHFLNKVL